MAQSSFDLSSKRQSYRFRIRSKNLLMHETLEVRPSQKARHVLTTQGELLAVPSDWALLPPGDAALSRRIKADGPSWTVKEKKGRKAFSRGIWAPADRIEALRLILKIALCKRRFDNRIATINRYAPSPFRFTAHWSASRSLYRDNRP